MRHKQKTKVRKTATDRFIKVFIIFGIVFCSVIIIIFTKITSHPKSERKQCMPVSKNKAFVDSVFTQVECKGLITKIELSNSPVSYDFHYLYIDIDNEYGYHYAKKVEGFDFTDNSTGKIGLSFNPNNIVSVGDTFLKIPGEFYYFIINSKGDSIKSELYFPGYCRGNDCTFDRSNGQLCYTINWHSSNGTH